MNLLKTGAAIVLTAASLAITALPAAALPHGGTSYDLGVNTSRVPFTTAGVASYIAGQPAETRSAVLGACAHFLGSPNSAQSQDTVDFCGLALSPSAASNVRTFSAVTPFVAAPALSPLVPSTPNLRPNCATPHYTVDPTDPCYLAVAPTRRADERRNEKARLVSQPGLHCFRRGV